MEQPVLRVLIADPSKDDAKAIELLLTRDRAPYIQAVLAGTLESAAAQAKAAPTAVALLNPFLPDSRGLATIETWAKRFPEMPVVALLDKDQTVVASGVMTAGAQDYLVKGDFDARLLTRVAMYAIDKKKLELKVQQLSHAGLEYVSIVSHELRAPLAITREGVTLILDNILGKITDKQSEVLKISKRNIDRLDHIIMNMLDITKLEAGKMVITREPVDLVEVVKHIALSFDERVREKGLTLRVTSAAESLRVMGDKHRLIEVMAHLVGNAVKFTKEGGIEIRLGQTGSGEAQCTVSDTGIGIAKDDWPKIFRKFQQFGWAPGGGEKGLGLGLAITKGIIDLHHGKIAVESEPGKGTRFTITLPKAS